MYSATMIVEPSDTTVVMSSLFTSSPPAGLETENAVLRRWAMEFLSKSHAGLGRKGPVCPFTLPAIKKDLFWVSFLRGRDLERSTVSVTLTEVIRSFQEAAPSDGPDAQLKSVILVFPDTQDYALIDAIQLEFKNLFIKYGLMVGQFYPGCNVGGLWNPDFKALNAPYAMLAIRHMTGSDYPFLTSSEEWASAYLTRFAPEIPPRVRNDMVKHIVAGAVTA